MKRELLDIAAIIELKSNQYDFTALDGCAAHQKLNHPHLN